MEDPDHRDAQRRALLDQATEIMAQRVKPAPGAIRKPVCSPLGKRATGLPPAIRELLDKPVSCFEELAGAAEKAGEEPVTHIAFVLDDSGSMREGMDATIEGFNSQVREVREGAKTAGRTTFTDVRFGARVRVECVAEDISCIPELSAETYRPSGTTPLYDGLGITLSRLLEQEGIHDAKTATLVTLFTDGGENSSRIFDAEILREVIVRLEATDRWTFALVGPSDSVSTLAELLSVRADNVRAYDPAKLGSRRKAFEGVSAASASYMRLRSMGLTSASSLHGTDDSEV
ncbi:VWA domain-containing protein [Caldimonas tepidiphila]|uniref:VWA domain-containing protein n=1 Tax=Caldimonas tepidiphila TaxID=2315841 RepID=UPI000E5B2CDC|nr:VWA domain-containing protein [Caldimonas tepidiphila]